MSSPKVYGDRLHFVSWTEGNQGKIFYYDFDRKIFGKYDLNRKKHSPEDLLVIGNYILQGDAVVYQDNLKFELIKQTLKDTFHTKLFADTDVVRFEVANDNSYLVSGWRDDDLLAFYKKKDLNRQTETYIKVGDEYMDTDYSGIVLDGDFHANDSLIVAVPYSTNRIYKFNKNSEYLGKTDLIYNNPGFKFRSDTKGHLYTDPNNLLPNKDAFLSKDNKIYILTKETKQNILSDDCQYFIDVYDLNTDMYEKSFVIDCKKRKPTYICFYRDLLVVLDDNGMAFNSIKAL
ncbi:MAG: hypothetical protein Q4G08_06320 [Capnocytophaga sp.]|nr:hypothetical protein [Capnocytophaga sp.]